MLTTKRFTRRGAVRIAALLATGALAAGALAACSSASDDEAAAPSTSATMPAQMTTVKVAINPSAQYAAMYYGIQQGIFKKHNLTLDVQPQANIAQTVAGLLSGAYQFGQTTPIHVVSAAAQGQNIIEVSTVEGRLGEEDKGTTVVASKASGVTDIKDLAGKKVATVGLTSNNTYATDELVAQAGGDWKSINFIQMPFGQMAGALDTGAVDVAIMQQPFASQAQASGGTALGYPSAIYKNGATTVFDASQQYIDEHPDVVRAFSDSMIESLRAAAKDEDAASLSLVDSIMKYSKDEALNAVRNKNDAPCLTVSSLVRAADLLKKYGDLTTDVDVNELVWPGALECKDATSESTPAS